MRLKQRVGHTKRGFEASHGPTPEHCLPSSFVDKDEERWVVTRIGAKRTRAGVLYYQVFWEGYVEPSWEPADMITKDAPIAVKQFLDSLSSGSGQRRRGAG
jgi:hypothetical protein